ncbi:MAG TPA: TonB-dependent receptor [Longimicrobiaceae bacterium]|nr:TonB-dependent receptor [Longimicrobiaceae bacterium]
MRLLRHGALLGALLLGTVTGAQAQTTIRGTVTDARSNAPLAGAQVQVKDTGLGTTTNAQGRYSLSVPTGADTLIFTMLGYAPQRVAIAGRSSIDVVMQASALQLQQIVAVGYGTQKKVNLTGAVASVDAEEMTKLTVPTVSQALQGLSPGLQVVDNGGAPGRDNASIKIRGIGTISNPGDWNDNHRANPLVLIDGVEGDLNLLNIEDIASISVLKDAASAAIYGSRAANGVILITTKRGKAQKDVTVTYDGYYGIQSITTFPKRVSVADHMRLTNVAYVNAGRAPKYSQEYIEKTLSGEDPLHYPTTDWVGLFYNPAPMQNHSLRVSGGSETARFALSANFMKQDGLEATTGATRYSARLNTDFNPTKRLSAGLDLAGSRHWDIQPAMAWDATFYLIHDTPPTVAAQYPDGSWGWSATGRNPLAYAQDSGDEQATNYNGTATARVNYDLVPGWLQINTLASASYDHGTDSRFLTQESYYDHWDPTQLVASWGPNELRQTSGDGLQTTLRALLNYGHTFLGSHDVSGVIGFEQIHQSNSDIGARRQQFWNNDIRVLPLGSPDTRDNWGGLSEWALRSGFGRLKYSYQGKYLFEANARYDGSSRFAKGNRYGFFPSFSAAWRISEEPFFRNHVGFVDELKLRGSWGQLGNQDVGLYQYYSTISLTQPYYFGGSVNTGAAKTTLTNPDISWETTTATDFGVDATFLANRLSFTGDYYVRRTDDILLNLPIMAIVGRSAPTVNAGSVDNRGWEVALGWQDRAGGVDYSVNFNLADNHNEVVDLNGTGPYVSGEFATLEGHPIWSYYGYEALGLFQSQEEIDNWAKQPATTVTHPGDIKWKDQNGDGVINQEDRVVFGSNLPHYSFGMNLAASWKNLDVSAFFQGVGKMDRYIDLGLAEGPVWENFTTNWHLDYWTPDNPDARVPAPYLYENHNTNNVNSWWLTDARYVKLRDIQLGYTLPEHLTKDRFNVSRLRFYVAGKNLWQWNDMAIGLDPEVPWPRGDYYPQTKIVSVGTNVTF